jgi:hypothetical protein
MNLLRGGRSVLALSIATLLTLTACKGDAGPTGPAGPAGTKGDTGPQGIPGTAGLINRVVLTQTRTAADQTVKIYIPLANTPLPNAPTNPPVVTCYKRNDNSPFPPQYDLVPCLLLRTPAAGNPGIDNGFGSATHPWMVFLGGFAIGEVAYVVVYY